MSLRRQSTGWLPSGRVKLNWKLSLWKPWQPRIFLLGNLINAQTYQGQPGWGSDGWDPHSPNHRSTAKVQIIIDLISIVMSMYDSWLLYQGGDRCAGSANPKRGKSDCPERRDGEEEILFPSCTSPSCKPLHKDLAWSTLDLLRWRPSAGRADAKWTWSQKPRLELLNWFIFTSAFKGLYHCLSHSFAGVWDQDYFAGFKR